MLALIHAIYLPESLCAVVSGRAATSLLHWPRARQTQSIRPRQERRLRRLRPHFSRLSRLFRHLWRPSRLRRCRSQSDRHRHLPRQRCERASLRSHHPRSRRSALGPQLCHRPEVQLPRAHAVVRRAAVGHGARPRPSHVACLHPLSHRHAVFADQFVNGTRQGSDARDMLGGCWLPHARVRYAVQVDWRAGL